MKKDITQVDSWSFENFEKYADKPLERMGDVRDAPGLQNAKIDVDALVRRTEKKINSYIVQAALEKSMRGLPTEVQHLS